MDAELSAWLQRSQAQLTSLLELLHAQHAARGGFQIRPCHSIHLR